jgi:outer membrane protein assembly factor BamB
MLSNRVNLTSYLVLAAALAALSAARAALAAEAADLAKRLGSTHGVCAVLGDTDCRLAIGLARSTNLLVYVQLAGAAETEAARRAADKAGLYGNRIFVEQGRPARIHLADDMADGVIVLGDAAADRKEVLRVLRPDGKAILGETEVTKPWPAGVDDWSHHYHGPDNNTQSRDKVARAPFMTQFIAEPRYAPAPQCVVSSAGRLFMAFGHVAWHEREEPVLNTLIAMNGFNGAVLWKRPLKSGFMVDRSTMIATPTTLYLGEDASCKLLDAATGEVKGEIAIPADLADGAFWKWMALEGGTLYALIGRNETADDVARWRMTGHGWPWDRISKGYNQPECPWGLGSTLVAVDPETKKVLWHRRQDPPIDSRALAMKNGRIYFYIFGKQLACLDAATGKDLWRKTAETDPSVFREIGPFRPGQGYVEGWRSAAFMKCTDKALYFVGPQTSWLSAVSAEDGRFLWKFTDRDLQVVVREEGLYTIGPQRGGADSKRLDPLTGQVLATYAVQRRACTRATGGADGIFFRANEGSVRLDTQEGKPQWITPMRPSCHVGVVVAGGHFYWMPWACDCNLQMFGVIACGPAGDFTFGRDAVESERLEKGPADAARAAPFDESPADWPAYRANAARTARTEAVVQKAAPLWEFKPENEFEPTAPVAAGGLVFVGGSDGIVRALDCAGGRPSWVAYTGGAIRYPPTIAGGRAFVGSGDGWAYAFEAARGRLLWRFRASPLERKISLYGALQDTWPVAAGVLVDGGVAYLAAGMNNFDGTHVYALDAATGRIKWQNNSSGHLEAFSRRGVAVQGDMLLNDGKLYLAGGDAVSPGVFEAATGKCLNAPPNAPGSQAPRGRELSIAGAGVQVSGQPLYSRPGFPVYDGSVKWNPQTVEAKNATLTIVEGKGEKGPVWTLAARDRASRDELWSRPLPGEPVRWGLAVDRRGSVIVALRDGRILCYGAAK